MAKPDFLPLLQPGMHNLSIQDLHNLAVQPFVERPRRDDLFQKLTTWIAALQGLGIGGTLWLDGSFLTDKPDPSDIDCVLWRPRWINGDGHVTAQMRQDATHLLDRTVAENLFGLDLYIEVPEENDIFHKEAYWRGVLGFGHDRITAKGFAEVNI